MFGTTTRNTAIGFRRGWTVTSMSALALMLGCSGGFGSRSDASSSSSDHDATTSETDLWPPAVSSGSDSAEVTPAGGEVDFFSGQLTLDVPADALKENTSITVERRLIESGGVELVGYIWGPHGKPIDPPADLTVLVDAAWIPPNTSLSRTGLLLVDGEKVTALQGTQAVQQDGGRVLITGKLDTLGTIAIGPIPTP